MYLIPTCTENVSDGSEVAVEEVKKKEKNENLLDLCDAVSVAPGMQQRELICRHTDHLQQSVVCVNRTDDQAIG